MFHFYILRCKDNSLYCGSAKDIKERIKKHNSGKGSAYVRSRGGGELIYKESFRTWSKTLRREVEVKKWSKVKKENLVRTLKHTA